MRDTLQAFDLAGDQVGRVARLTREAFGLARHHGKPLFRLASPRRLDGRVQRQEVDLAGDFADQVDNLLH